MLLELMKITNSKNSSIDETYLRELNDLFDYVKDYF